MQRWLCRLTCELTGAVGYDGVWGRMKWSPKRRHAPLLPVERMVRLLHCAGIGFLANIAEPGP